MARDILSRYHDMKQDAKERSIKLRDGEVATLVLADIMEDIDVTLREVDKTLIAIAGSLHDMSVCQG